MTGVINTKRVLLSLGLITAIAAIVISGTGAFFSDTETSAGNVFTAGSIDLKVDHAMQTYNGADCETCSVTVFSSAAGTDVTSGTGAYAGAYPTDAAELSFIHPAWEPEASAAPAQWVWVTDPVLQADTTADAEYTFQNKFQWNGGVESISLALALAADNGYKIVLNGVEIVDNLGTEFNYGDLVNTAPFQAALEAEVQTGENVLEITVRNKAVQGGTPSANPAGLMFRMNIERPDQECAADSDFQNMCRLWSEKDLEEGDKFFNFNDIKPGDWGTNVISLHVYDNDAFTCVFPHGIEESENGMTEPEEEDDTTEGGDLGGVLKFFAWVDNGDGEYDAGDEAVIAGPGASFADAWNPEEISLTASTTAYLGLAWCAGTQTNNDGEIECDGSTVDNASQSDSLIADITAYAVQQRNNADFSCADVIAEYNGGGEEEDEWIETSSAGGDVVVEDGFITLVTADDVNSRVRYTNYGVDIDVEDVTMVRYDSKQVSAFDPINGNASLRLIVDLDGDGVGTTTKDITFEPYYNIFAHNDLNPPSIMTGVEQTWSADQTKGKWWASGVTTAAGVSGGGGAYATNFTLQQLAAAYPGAKVVGISVGMGTYNKAQVVEVDDVMLNGDVLGF